MMSLEDEIRILENALRNAEDVKAKPKPRTVSDFVNDFMVRGRDLQWILIVATCTRWKSYIDQIKEYYNERVSKVNKTVS